MKSSIASTQQLLKFGLARLIRMMSTKLLEDLPIEWRRSSRHSPSSQWVKHPNRSKQATRSTTRYNYTNTFIRRKLYGQWADHLCIFKQQAQLLTATYCDKPHVCPTPMILFHLPLQKQLAQKCTCYDPTDLAGNSSVVACCRSGLLFVTYVNKYSRL